MRRVIAAVAMLGLAGCLGNMPVMPIDPIGDLLHRMAPRSGPISDAEQGLKPCRLPSGAIDKRTPDMCRVARGTVVAAQ